MQIIRRTIIAAAALGMISALLFIGRNSLAQESMKLAKPITIQAQAMGQAQEMGRSFGMNLYIEEFSSVEDQRALIEAFNQKKNEGLINALSKMNSKGRLSITGTLGYDVNYIRKFDMPDGSIKFRLVTDRPIRFGEAWSDSRSSDYNLSAAEIILTPGDKSNSGVLFPACEFTIDKENQLKLELYRNQWKLVNIRKR